MHRIAAIAAAGLFALASASVASAQTDTPDGGQSAKKPGENERVCRSQVKSGSRVQKRTICMSRKETDRLAAEARHAMDERLRSGAGSPMDTGK